MDNLNIRMKANLFSMCFENEINALYPSLSDVRMADNMRITHNASSENNIYSQYYLII